jgi:hypothetical protein
LRGSSRGAGSNGCRRGRLKEPSRGAGILGVETGSARTRPRCALWHTAKGRVQDGLARARTRRLARDVHQGNGPSRGLVQPRKGPFRGTGPYASMQGTARGPAMGQAREARPRTKRGAVEEAAETQGEGPSFRARDRARRLARACGLLRVLARARRLARTRVSKGSLRITALARGLARARPRGLYKRPREGPCEGPCDKGSSRETLREALEVPMKDALQGAVRGPLQGPCESLCEGIRTENVLRASYPLETPLRTPGSTTTGKRHFQKRGPARANGLAGDRTGFPRPVRDVRARTLEPCEEPCEGPSRSWKGPRKGLFGARARGPCEEPLQGTPSPCEGSYEGRAF